MFFFSPFSFLFHVMVSLPFNLGANTFKNPKFGELWSRKEKLFLDWIDAILELCQ